MLCSGRDQDGQEKPNQNVYEQLDLERKTGQLVSGDLFTRTVTIFGNSSLEHALELRDLDVRLLQQLAHLRAELVRSPFCLHREAEALSLVA